MWNLRVQKKKKKKKNVSNILIVNKKDTRVTSGSSVVNFEHILHYEINGFMIWDNLLDIMFLSLFT